MMQKRKTINDPVAGFINIQSDLIYDIIQHPYFQRLNRIKQLGMSFTVYPGAVHTRFLHSIGAMHLMQQALYELKKKDIEITDLEAQSVLIAILLHDVGHAPFSHVLEHVFTSGITHEDISLEMMKEINRKNNGYLNTCINIFQDQYKKKFLHQLVSSQLDLDRLDYLNRDSFFTGVVEGAVGTERIINILNVWNDNLCVEAKGIYSIEKFLIARRIMYWQVYYHKTSVTAERMLINLLQRAKELSSNGEDLNAPYWFKYFLNHTATRKDFENNGIALKNYALFDDYDIFSVIKLWSTHKDKILSLISESLINRHLFKVVVSEKPVDLEVKDNLENSYVKALGITKADAHYLYSEVAVSTNTYSHKSNNSPIYILFNDNHVEDIANVSEIMKTGMLNKEEKKYYFCYYKL